jgi:CRP-like cAMP-binding protein
MREVLLNYTNALLAQSAQLAACHRYHTPKARLARLLLMINDRIPTAEVRITQDLLAHLLGTRRATVTQAVNQLQDKGLDNESCTCYAIISQQYSTSTHTEASSANS